MMVKNVMLNWREMAGETDEIRKLNSLLTSTFIGLRDIPADECLEHAQVILANFAMDPDDGFRPGHWKDRSRIYLRSMFAEGVDFATGARIRIARYDPLVDEVVNRAEAIIKGGPWPDRLVPV